MIRIRRTGRSGANAVAGGLGKIARIVGQSCCHIGGLNECWVYLSCHIRYCFACNRNEIYQKVSFIIIIGEVIHVADKVQVFFLLLFFFSKISINILAMKYNLKCTLMLDKGKSVVACTLVQSQITHLI